MQGLVSDTSGGVLHGARLAETEGISISGFRIVPAEGPVFSVAATRDLTLERGTVPGGVPALVSVEDRATMGVRVRSTDLRRLRRPVVLESVARGDAVTIE